MRPAPSTTVPGTVLRCTECKTGMVGELCRWNDGRTGRGDHLEIPQRQSLTLASIRPRVGLQWFARGMSEFAEGVRVSYAACVGSRSAFDVHSLHILQMPN